MGAVEEMSDEQIVTDSKGESVESGSAAPLPVSGRLEEIYASLFMDLYDATLIIDASGVIIDANIRAEQFFMYDRAELAGMGVNEVVVGMNSQVLAKVRHNIASGRYTVLNANCVRKNKDSFAAEIALSRIKIDGDPGLVFSIRNVSRRQSVREQLLKEQNALQHASRAIVIAGSNGSIQSVNKSFLQMWGFKDEDAVAKMGVSKLWMDTAAAEDLQNVPKSNKVWDGELLALKEDGTPFWVQATSAPNRDESGQVVGIVLSFVDISEHYKVEESIRKEIKGQMEKAKKKEDFSGMLNFITIPDIFQLIDSAGKSGTFSVMDVDGAVVGEVSFIAGRILSAHMGEVSGRDAVINLLRAGGEEFEFKSGTPKQTGIAINESTTGILLEASRVMDENDESDGDDDGGNSSVGVNAKA